MQLGHGAPELHGPVRQQTGGSERGKKEVEIENWSGFGMGTKGQRSREEIQGMLALSATYSGSISKQQSLCFILTDSLNFSISAPAR